MVVRKTFSDIVQDSLRYLIQNTSVTYFADGSIAKALVEATSLEISRLQEFVSGAFQNAFLSSASGVYLDMWGETLGLPRLRDRRATAQVQDGAVRFYTTNGTLGSRLPHPTNLGLGQIPQGITITNAAGTVEFVVTETVSFPVNAKSVFVSVAASDTGSGFNVGVNQLTVHNLGKQEVKVTNDISIATGRDIEPDEEYRFRLSRAMTARFGSNLAAIELAAVSNPSISRAEVLQFARGAGTFDVLLIPQGNRVTNSARENTRRAIEQVSAYGVSFNIREPEYVPIKITAQLSFFPNITEGEKLSARQQVQSALLAYIASIPLGGELVINQVRATCLSVKSVKDVKILELYIDCKPRTLRDVQLREDELFIPDEEVPDAIEVV
jgi:uncharacterized phage protein gp47/JayE